MDEEDRLSHKMDRHMNTVADGFGMLICLTIIPVVFVVTLPLWLIGKVGQAITKREQVIE